MNTGIQVQLWNILKYVLLTLLLAPIAESAMSRITAWRNARLVNRGEPIRLKSSALGNIALHQEVETMHVSSRFWQLFSVLLALGIALPFEYSSGAQSQLVWSEQRSLSSAKASNGSDEHILLALDNPAQQSECVSPSRLADVGEFVFLQPREDKPPLLNSVVTPEDLNALFGDRAQRWTSMVLHSRNGATDLLLFAGGRGGQQALIGNSDRESWLVADFESGSLCKGFLDDTFSCYEIAGQLTISQLVYSIASVSGGSLFFRTQFEKAAKLFRFKAGLVTNSIGDPSVEENLFEQKLNESGFEWLSRLEGENPSQSGTQSLSISTIKLDSQLRSTGCESVGSVRIRPLQLQVDESLNNESFDVKVSAAGDLKLVKAGTQLQTIVLTRVDDDWNCAVDLSSGVCVNATDRTLYILTKAAAVYEYTTVFALRVTQSVGSPADLAVLQSQIVTERKRNGRFDSWDFQNLLPVFDTPMEGARSITRRLDTSVTVSSGVRVTGTVETWAVVLYGCLLLLFMSVALFSRLKSLSSIHIERMYRRVVWQKEALYDDSETPNKVPIIGTEATVADGVGALTASYYNTNETPTGRQQDQSIIEREDVGS